MTRQLVWLDADPGHDDATAILLAAHNPKIHLLGVSTTHGNTNSGNTAHNAARCLVAFRADPSIKVYPGAAKPLLRPARADAQIHGVDGLGGVEGLPPSTDPAVHERFAKDSKGNVIRALEGMATAFRAAGETGQKVVVVSTGPMTNVALFVSVYPDLLEVVQEFVFMGGGVGVGNRSAVAEYNILCDPHAAQIVLDAPVKKTMIPLNVTHLAIFTKERQAKLLSPGHILTTESPELPLPKSPIRHTLSTLVSFFAEAYKRTFNFIKGPPLHDPLTIAYIVHPELFKVQRYRVDVELEGKHSVGETVVDVWHYRSCDDSWGSHGKNCLVAESLDVDGFFEILYDSVARCESQL